jgi:hypothetical protein
MKVNDIVYGMQTVQIRMPHGVICYQANTGLHPTGDRLLQLYREAITTIADALNAPVLATEEVLAGLPKDAKVLTYEAYHDLWHTCFYYIGEEEAEDGWAYNELVYCPQRERIVYGTKLLTHEVYIKVHDNDPKTAEYLRQFTRRGVRRVG